MVKTKVLKLSPELEKALVAGVLYGAVPLDAVRGEELSGPGRSLYRAAQDLILGGHPTPLPLSAVLLALTDVHGVNRDTAKAMLEAVKAALPSASGAQEVVRRLREKHALMSVANEAAGQLQRGEFNPEKLVQVASATNVSPVPISLADVLEMGMPEPPPRLPLKYLPNFSDRIGGGLVGVTVASGEPAVGKSTLAWQVALDANQHVPVLYYDLDNGLPTLMERTRMMLGDDPAVIKAATQKLYLRDSVRTLDSDLMHVPPPALVVVDIFQALPTLMEYERQGLAHWIHRLKGLRPKGYHVLVVSEVPRSTYGTPSLAGFKGSGEIEYAADLAFQMTPTPSGGAEVHVVKNRHGPMKGLCITLERVRGFVWREVAGGAWS